MILDAVICAVDAWLGASFNVHGLSHAKFLSPLNPNEAARIELVLREPLLEFAVYRENTTIAKGTFRGAMETAS